MEKICLIKLQEKSIINFSTINIVNHFTEIALKAYSLLKMED